MGQSGGAGPTPSGLFVTSGAEGLDEADHKAYGIGAPGRAQAFMTAY